MKRIISLILAVLTIACALAFSVNAAGTLIHSDDFSEGMAAKNWMINTGTLFKWHKEDQCIYGYGEARVLETRYDSRDNKVFDKFYTSMDVRICDFDDMEPATENHVIGFWYRDRFENEKGAQGCVYQFFVEVETGDAYVLKSTYGEEGFTYRDENNILQTHVIKPTKICEGKINGKIEVGEDAPWFNVGMRVTDGRIEGYFNEELVCFAEFDPDGEKLGDVYLNGVDPTVGSQKCPILIWSGSSFAKQYVKIDNFEVWTDDYDFDTTLHGDVNGDEKINLGDVSLVLKKIAKWDVTLGVAK